MKLAATALWLLLLPPASAMAQTALAADRDDTLSVFAGRFTNEYFENSLSPVTTTYDDNFVVGGAYQHFFLGSDGGLKLGTEIGAAARFGDAGSAEVWTGVVGRYEGLVMGDIRVAPVVTVGLSLETAPVGIEAERAEQETGDPTLLFYLGPELAVSSVSDPHVELFLRLHHRSGGWKTLGNMRDGANAIVVGVRSSF